MKKIKLFLLPLFLLCAFLFVACSGNSSNTSTQTGEKVDLKEFVKNLEFNDLSVDYDGKEHALTFDKSLPDGYTFKIVPDRKFTEPGQYDYDLEVTFNNEKAVKTATLTINKITPKYTGEKEFDIYLNNLDSYPTYTFDHEGIELVDEPEFGKAGDYKVKISTKVTNRYKAIEPVEITYHVHNGIYNLELESETIVVNDTNPTASLAFKDLTNLPEGYKVEYVNNNQTERGKYKVTGKVLDNNNNLVETYKAVLNVDIEENPAFNLYVDEFFVNEIVADDQFAINLFFVHPENYGVSHGDPEFYSYTSINEYTSEEYNYDKETVKEMREKLESFDKDSLSFGQLNTYDSIEAIVRNYEELFSNVENLKMRQTYVDQYGGYCADLPTQVEGYTFRNLQDIDDCLVMLESVYDAFDSYYTFIVDREANGYGLSESTLKNFYDYLDGVVKVYDDYNEYLVNPSKFNEEKTPYYLNNVIEDKLTDAQIALGFSNEILDDYKLKFSNVLATTDENPKSLYRAHKDLSTKVKEYINVAKSEGHYLNSSSYTGQYLGAYEGGKDLYFSMLKNKLGLSDDVTPEAYVAELDEYMRVYNALYRKYKNLANTPKAKAINAKYEYVEYDDIDDLIDFLKEFAKTIVPDLESTPEIGVTWMDPTITANTTTVAYYLKSALDARDAEYIHLNERALKNDNLDTIRTLAHEGYPGHLYAYVFSKEQEGLSNLVRMNTNTGHGEGWAKYVENALCEYFIKQHDDLEEWQAAMRSTEYWDLLVFCIYARADFGINYEGWDVARTKQFMEAHSLNSDKVQGFFDTLNEGPTQYAPYGYGFAVFDSLHTLAKEELGVFYDEVEFNTVLLQNGWIGLSKLKDNVAEYLNLKKFTCGLAA